MENDELFMREALSLAAEAISDGDVPVGAVVVNAEGKIIGRGRNRREADKNATAHAEMIAIEEACRAISSWRLSDCTLYVTLEPCPMCAGGIVNARLSRVVFGATDEKAGCFGGKTDFNAMGFNHRPEICAGVLAEECAKLLSDFFTEKRPAEPRKTEKTVRAHLKSVQDGETVSDERLSGKSVSTRAGYTLTLEKKSADGKEAETTVFRWLSDKPDVLHLKKTGDTSLSVRFCEGENCPINVATPYGNLPATVRTKKLDNHLPESGTLTVEYDLRGLTEKPVFVHLTLKVTD